MMSPNVSAGFSSSSAAKLRVFSYVAHPPPEFWYDRMTFMQSSMRAKLTTGSPNSRSSAMTALRPSELQSEMGQPWSCVLNGQAPFEMCR